MMKISFRSDDYKYIATLRGPAVESLDTGGVHSEELYDLGRDPLERTNLLAPSDEKDPAVVEVARDFREALSSFFTEAKGLRSGRQGDKVDLNESVKERLKALGYVEQD